MYAVTQDFIERMRADKRRVLAKVIIDYTDPTVSNEIQIEATDQANISYPKQSADNVTAATHKWASLDGTWRLDQDYRLAPKMEDLYQYQFGWWSASLSGADGTFAAPYPTLIVTHPPRPIYSLRVVGDSARGEWMVDFVIRLKGEDGTVLYTETVTSNTAVDWQKSLTSTIFGVAQQELEIRRWSHPGRNAKILEFFTSFQETYYSDDIVEIRLLEEREASQGSLPVGNITANEISIRLANEGGKFDPTNPNSPLFRLLKPNRRIRAWLGTVAENLASDKAPTFKRNSVAYLSTGQQVASGQPRFETISGRTGVLVEESTTNLRVRSDLTDAPTSKGPAGEITVSIVGIALLGYQAQVRRVSRTGSTTWAFAEWSSGIVTSANHAVSVYVKPDTVVAGEKTEVMLIEVSRQPQRYVFLKITWGAGGTIASVTPHHTNWTSPVSYGYEPADDGWYRVWLVCPADVNPSMNPRVRIVPCIVAGAVSDKAVFVGGVQVEQKNYPTSLMSTAGASATRAAETLTIPTAGVLEPSEGTIEIWAYLDGEIAKPSGLARQYIIFGHYTPGGPGYSNRWLIGRTQDGYWRFETSNNAGERTQILGTQTPTVGWHLITARWLTTEIALFLDDVKLGFLPSPKLPETLNTIATVGSWATNEWHGNIPIGLIRISRRARTDQEIAAAYAAGTLEWDEDTTYLVRFDGDMYPVEQVWVPLGTFWSLDWDSPDDSLEASVVARDRLELLRKSTYQPGQVQQHVSLYTLAEQVLIDAGLKAGEYWIDPTLQQTVIPWAWLSPTSHREALRIIAEAALAVVYADRDGVIRIETMGSVPTEQVLEITADDYFPPLRAPAKQESVANEIIVTTQPLVPAATPEEVYRSTTPINVPAGQTVKVTVQYTQVPVIQASASLDAPPAGVSITAATYYAWGAEVSIQNTGASQASVTLVITGKPLSVQGGEQVVVRDDASILENGTLRYEFPANPLVQTLAQAQAIASALLASAKDPRRDIEVEWRGNPALELGDRVTIVGQDVHVIRQEIEWAGALTARLTGRKVT